MAGMNHMRHPVETISRGRQLLVGSFRLNGNASPVVTDGGLFKTGSVARTGVGVNVFTFKAKPGKLKSVIAALRGAFTAGDYLQWTFDEAAGTITFTTKDGGGATDIPSGEAVFVEIWAWVSHMKSPKND